MNLRPGPENSGIWKRRDFIAAPPIPIAIAITAATVQTASQPAAPCLPGRQSRGQHGDHAHQHSAFSWNRGERPGALQRLPDVLQVVHGVLVQFHGLRPGRRHHSGSYRGLGRPFKYFSK